MFTWWSPGIRYISKQVGAVEGDHFHSGIHHTLGAVNIPIDVDKASRLFFAQTGERLRSRSVNADSAASSDKANDGVTWNWRATAGKANKKIFETFNMNPRFAIAPQPMAKDLFGRRIDNTTRVERARHSRATLRAD